MHSRESTDAKPTLEANVALARQRGLDFLEISDHNTITQLDFFDAIQAAEPSFLLLPGIEFTTYAGHANAIGATAWVDHKIGQPGVTIGGAFEQITAQGAIVSINHPVLDLGDLCIGCAWKHPLDAAATARIGGVEIGTGALSKGGALFTPQAIAYWDALLDRGLKVPALGGSDDHRAGVSDGNVESPIGSPTTLVRATELSAAGLLDGIRRGATVVKLEGPTDPMAELEVTARKGDATAAVLGYPGDTVRARSVVVRARVTGAAPTESRQVRLVKNGVPAGEPVDVTTDPFVLETIVDAPASGEDRYRVEVLSEGAPLTVTSHVWLGLDPSGPQAEDASATDDGGCTTSPRPASTPSWMVLTLLTLLTVAALRGLGARARRARPGATSSSPAE